MTCEPIIAPGKLHPLRPLCVDLDGTLVKSDTLHDSLLVLAGSFPFRLLRLPGEVLRGKAAFKAFVTGAVTLDVRHLPYNRALLKYLETEHTRGRAIYLATGADIRLAQRIADYLGIFTGVLGSDGATNLTGKAKLDVLRREFGELGFDYIGNDTPDMTLLAASAEPMIANPTVRLRMRLRRQRMRPAREFCERAHPFKAVLRAMHVRQWAKNVVVFLPLLLMHTFGWPHFLNAVLAFVCFCSVASAAYVANDLLDIQADRSHAHRRARPFAAGELGAAQGVALIVLLLALALLGMRILPAAIYGWLAVYLAGSFGYFRWLKHVPTVDVLALTCLYMLRILVGSVATGKPVSDWLAGFAVFLFLSLAMIKRLAELQRRRPSPWRRRSSRGYLAATTRELRSYGIIAATAATVIFAIYVASGSAALIYHKLGLLWIVMPCLILWLYRVWRAAFRGELKGDPLVFGITDPLGAVLAAVASAAVILAH